MIYTTLPKQAMFDGLMFVEHVQYRVRVLGQRRSEHNRFKLRSKTLQELVHARPLKDVDVVYLVINLYGNNKVGVGYRLKFM